MNREVNRAKRVQTVHGGRYCRGVVPVNGRVNVYGKRLLSTGKVSLPETTTESESRMGTVVSYGWPTFREWSLNPSESPGE